MTIEHNIKTSEVKNAIKNVMKFSKENPKSLNQLFDNDEIPLYLTLSVLKLPLRVQKVIHRLNVVHSFYSADVCLIVPDVKGIKNKEHEKHLEHYEELFRRKGIENIKKIMTFHEFRTEFENFELRSSLVDLYDVFLVDGRISGKVVKKCGKIFYKRKRVPIPIKLQATNLQGEIERALKKTPLHFHGKGDCYNVQFGTSSMKESHLVKNALEVINQLDCKVVGGFENIRSISVWSNRATPIPIYLSLANTNEIPTPMVEKKKPKHYKQVTGELSTKMNMKVIVKPSGHIKIKKIKDIL